MARKAVLAAIAIGFCAHANAEDVIANPLHMTAQPIDVPASAWLSVEIPLGSSIKYETDVNGRLFVDRFLAMPVAYPANYGSMPRTRAGDGDPLDALVLTRTPLHPGVLIRFRPIAVLRMEDRGMPDQKIIGVPLDSIDADYAPIRDLKDLPVSTRDRIEAFFRVYKQSPTGTAPVELSGWGDAAEAGQVITESIHRFDALK